jgi:preprotein translocase subunit SecE
MSVILNLLNFLREIKTEIRKITWPSRDDIVGTVIVVCLFTLVAAILLSAMDAGFSSLIKQLIS